MTTSQTQPRLTFEQFFDYDDGTARQFELLDGIPIAMLEPSDLHNDIVCYLNAQCQRAIAIAGLP